MHKNNMSHKKTTRDPKKINRKELGRVKTYLNEITRIPLFTNEQEEFFAKLIKENNQEALNKFIEANLRFVVNIAKEFQDQGMHIGDLINEGNYGLIKAAQRFDESKGFKFISYAVYWCRQAILAAFAKEGRLVRATQPMIVTYNKATQLSLSFLQENEREPSLEELSAMIKVGVKTLKLAVRINYRHTELDKPIFDEEGAFRGIKADSFESDSNPIEELESSEFKRLVRSMLKDIPAPQADALNAHFKLDGDSSPSKEAVAKKYGYVIGYIQSLQEKGLKNLYALPQASWIRKSVGIKDRKKEKEMVPLEN
jgi:RNA polymerase primary sigma factor